MKHSKDVIWVGRFQPPSIAHFHTLITILEQWPRVTIGVVSDKFYNVDRKGMLWDQYRSMMRPTGKNLFSADEIVALWSQAIITNDLCDRVNVRSIIRPECSSVFDIDFCPSKYDYVEVELGAGDMNVENFRKYHSREMYKRAIYWVRPFLILHNSQIKKLVAEKRGSWSDYLAPGTFKAFNQFNGSSRIVE